MIKYSVENFGVFKGLHTFDLSTSSDPDHRKPLVIFGGMNGAGKTTLFEGVKLCIYGPSFRGHKLSRPYYEKYLRSRIHRGVTLSESEGTSVSLEFQHSHLGIISRYFVKRSWSAAATMVERLDVLQDGRPVGGVTDEQLQDFLMELIPIGLSKLFFFDGEQIQNLADDEPNNRHLTDAFNSLLGLDIVEHLQTDLKIYLTRQLRAATTSDQDYQALEEEQKRLETEIELLEQRKAQKQSNIDHVNSEMERMERQIASEGGGFADRRVELRSRKVVLESQIINLEEKLRELASSLLPFSIIPSLCVALKDRLLFEERLQKEIAAGELLHQMVIELNEKLRSGDFWGEVRIDESSKNIISSEVLKIIRSIAQPKTEGTTFLHQLSIPDQRKLLNWIDESLNWLPAELRVTTGALENKIRDLRSVDEALSRAPPDEAMAPLIQQLNALYEERGGLVKEMKIIEEKIRHCEFTQKENVRKQDKMLEEKKRLDAVQRRIDLGNSVLEVLQEFEDILRLEKLKAVSEQFTTAFNELATKKKLIENIRINPNDFSITLFRKGGKVIPKDELSAGEKQVYAIAMLVALARISGRPLPFMIDTPLARLDRKHRANLVSNFFPHASHQVIIFSTDTEIDQKYFGDLTPFITRVYRLTYDDTEACTKVSSNYFWETRRVKV